MKVFLGRYDIAQSIIREMQKGGQKPSILLYGSRRMGKTSALLNIGYLMREPDLVPVYISGQSAKFHTDLDFCYYLAAATIEKLQQYRVWTEPLSRRGFAEKPTFERNPVLTLSEFFDECHRLLEQHDKHCLFSIDEYEEIDQHIRKPGRNRADCITRELLLELRDTLQHKPRLMFLFAGTHFMRDLATVNWSEIFINVKTLHISFLERRDGQRLLTEPVPELKYENTTLITHILDLTGCQPFLLQAVASALVDTLNTRDERTVTKHILNEAIDEVLANHSTYFDYIWDTECSNSRQQKLLRLVAGAEAGTPVDDLTDYSDELRSLIAREVLKEEDDRVKLTMPIVKLWMKKHKYILY